MLHRHASRGSRISAEGICGPGFSSTRHSVDAQEQGPQPGQPGTHFTDEETETRSSETWRKGTGRGSRS